jgi:hypothetical protein
MGVGKVLFLESSEVFGPLLVEGLLNHRNILVKRLDQVVLSSMFLNDHIHAWEP